MERYIADDEANKKAQKEREMAFQIPEVHINEQQSRNLQSGKYHASADLARELYWPTLDTKDQDDKDSLSNFKR